MPAKTKRIAEHIFHAGFSCLVRHIIQVAGLIRIFIVNRRWNNPVANHQNAGDQLHATTKWARAQAIAEGQIFRLHVDAHSGAYWVTMQDGTEFVQLENEFSRETLLDDGQRIKLTDEQDQPIEFVTFYPTGRIAPPCNLSISDDRGQVDLICRTPAEGFQLRKPGEVLER